MDHREPLPHPVSYVNTTRNYVTQTVQALLKAGPVVERSWLDPADPRDATILLQDTRALVWDEEYGWRIGLFRAGRQGVRTEMEGAVHLGGGPVPAPDELAARVWAGVSASARKYRSYEDSDGLDEVFHRY